jgi:hypothetical protein
MHKSTVNITLLRKNVLEKEFRKHKNLQYLKELFSFIFYKTLKTFIKYIGYNRRV